MIILRTITEPTDVYIMGTSWNDDDPDFGITDDYASITVKSGKEETYLETIGFVYIRTKAELQADLRLLETALDSSGDEDEEYIMVLRDFAGDISLEVLNNKSEVLLERLDEDKDYLCEYEEVQDTEGDYESYLCVFPPTSLDHTMSLTAVIKELQPIDIPQRKKKKK